MVCGEKKTRVWKHHHEMLGLVTGFLLVTCFTEAWLITEAIGIGKEC